MSSRAALELLIELQDHASKGLGSIGGSLRSIGETAIGMFAGGLLTKGFDALTSTLGDAFDGAREAGIIMAQTQQTINSMGNAAGVSAQHVADFASSLSDAAGKSLFGDDQIQAATNMLLTFGNIKGATLDLATTLSTDMAQALKSTPEAMSKVVGKILNSADAMSAAQRMGVSFSDEQIKLGKHLFETGHIAEYQALVMKELNAEFGGQAAAAAQAAGGMVQFKARLGEAAETLVGSLLPFLDQGAALLNTVVAPAIEAGAVAFGNLVTMIQSGASAFAILSTILPPDIVAGIQTGLTTIQGLLAPFIATFTDARTPVEGFMAVLSQISPTFALVLAAVNAALPPIQAIIMSVFGIISGFIAEHGAKIQADIGGAWQQIQALIAAIAPPIQAIIAAVFGAIATFLHAHGAEIQAFLGQTWDAIAEIVSVAIQLIQATIVPALVAIAGFISAHGAEIQAVLSAVWTIISTIISTALAIIKGVLTAALQAIHGDWSGAWETIKATVATVWEGIKTIIGAALEIVKTIISTTWDAIKGGVQAAWDAIKGAVQTALDGLVAAIMALPGQVAGAGAAIVQTIWDGISAKWQEMLDWFNGKLQEMRDMLPFSEPKDSSSPLYGLSQAGESIIGQILAGLQSRGGELADALGSDLGTVQNELRATLTGVGREAFDTTDAFRELLQSLGLTWEQTNLADTALQSLGAALQTTGPGSMEAMDALDDLMRQLGLSGDGADALRRQITDLAGVTEDSARSITRSSDQIGRAMVDDLAARLSESDLPALAGVLGGDMMTQLGGAIDGGLDGVLATLSAAGRRIADAMRDIFGGLNLGGGGLPSMSGGLPSLAGAPTPAAPALATAQGVSGGGAVFQAGAIVINAPAGANARQIADMVITEIDRRMRSKK